MILSPDRKRTRHRSLAMMLVLVAFVAIGLWAWRNVDEGLQAQGLALTIRSGSPDERLAAMDELWRLTPDQANLALPALLAALNDPSAPIRARASSLLDYAVLKVSDPSEVSETTATLLKALGHSDPAVRRGAVANLGRLYKEVPKSPASSLPPEVAQALLKATSDPAGPVREAALARLTEFEGDPKPRLALLLAATKDPDERVRALAVMRLGPEIGDSVDARRAVLHALSDPEKSVRAATGGFRRLPGGTVPIESLPDLIAALAYESPDLHRESVIEILEVMGSEARPAVPALLRLTGPDTLARVRDCAIGAVGAIAPESPEALALIPPLLDRLRASNVGWDGERAVSILEKFLWDPKVEAALRVAAKVWDSAAGEAARGVLRRRLDPGDRLNTLIQSLKARSFLDPGR